MSENIHAGVLLSFRRKPMIQFHWESLVPRPVAGRELRAVPPLHATPKTAAPLSILKMLISWTFFLARCLGVVVVLPLAALLAVALACLLVALLPGRRHARAVGFFHPTADGGGGGEKVLWWAMRATMLEHLDAEVVLFTGGDLSADQLRDLAYTRFNVSLPRSFRVIRLRSKGLLEPHRYPFATVLFQAIASLVAVSELGGVHLQALAWMVPRAFVDTSGWPFAYPLAWVAGCRVACYVHFPLVTMDMEDRVRRGHVSFNNRSRFRRHSVLLWAKVAYYRVLRAWYATCGRFADCVMVNSSWTRERIATLWGRPTHLVFPPCDVEDLAKGSVVRHGDTGLCVASVAQFAPEKDHAMQVEAFALARERWLATQPNTRPDAGAGPRLTLVGTCRRPSDRATLAAIRKLAEERGLTPACFEIREGLPWADVKDVLRSAAAGLHTMRDEHFGISVVEYMAAGAIPIAHRSGGPFQDIVVPAALREYDDSEEHRGRTAEEDGEGGARGMLHAGAAQDQPVGFLCSSAQEYADALVRLWSMRPEERTKMAAAARARAARFGTAQFQASWSAAMSGLLD